MERADIRRRATELAPWVNDFSFRGIRYASGSDIDYPLGQDPDGRARAVFEAFPSARRIIELGALEGADTLALSRYPGVTVLAIEGRETNFRRAEFVLDVHEVDNAELRLADVETLDFETLGRADVVVCAGLLYHVQRPWDLLKKIALVTDQLYLSTHYWGSAVDLDDVEGYGAKPVREDHPEPQGRGLSVDVRWLHRGSLFTALANAGFDAVTVLHERTSEDVCDLVAACRKTRGGAVGVPT